MSNLLNISSSPHVRDKSSTKSIMWDVFLALMPAAIFGIYNFSVKPRDINAILLIVVCIATCVLTEYIWQKAMKLPLTVSDGSAAVTGLLLALNLSSTFPIWMAIIGSVFAIIIVKQLFGGLGQNFMNPALGARCFLLIAFAADMTNFTVDGYSGATPLALIREQGVGAVNTMNMLIGKTAGTIGETSAIAILIGAMFLILMGVITLRIPGTYIITFVVFISLFGGHGFDIDYIVAELCGGGLMLGAFFMATDYVTSPITPAGQIIYGICCGLLTGIFRCFGANAEGVSFAIILSNILVPIIEKFTIPRAFGLAKEAKKNE